MTRSSSPESTPKGAAGKRFCGLLDICIHPAPSYDQPLSPPTPGGTTSKLVSSKHVPSKHAFSSKHAGSEQPGEQHEQQTLLQQHEQEQNHQVQPGSPPGWPCSPAALSRKLAGCRRRRCLVLQLLAALALVLLFSWPWILPGLVWHRSNTNWVVPGPEVDPVTYQVANKTLSDQYPVPRIIHQTWKTADVPERWRAAQQSCRDLHPDWEYRLWTDSDAVTFIQEHYSHLLASFESYPYNIERADAIRYLILHHHGGIYIDLDIVCLRSLDFLRAYEFIMPQTMPVGFSNDFLVGTAGHPFLEKLVTSLPRWNLRLGSKYPTVMFSTGPMFVTLQATFYRARRSLSVLPFSLYGKYTKKAADPLLQHLYGSSWHSSDARSILWIIKHPAVLGTALVLLILGTAVLVAWRKLDACRREAGCPRGSRAQIVALAESFKLT